MDQFTELVIPDLLLLTPFAWDGSNPHYSPDNRESTEWILQYSLFSDHRRGRLDALRSELLGAHTYPYTDAEALRIINDFVMLLFALDELTDVQDPDSAKASCDIFINALNRVSGNDDSPVTLCTKDFMTRLSCIASPEVCKRFLSHCIAYMDATAQEASLRSTKKALSFEEYLLLRRDNGGVIACFDLIEAALRITLPADVFEDPNFQHICCSANDMISVANDIYSYPVEYARGIELVNLITTVKNEKAISTQEAVDFVADHYKKHADIINSCKENIRSFGPEADATVRTYIHGLEQWVYGHLVWCFDTPRFFGQDREEVKRTLTVKVMQHKSLD